jgi:predicted enzyme related to lactoylglutathione lyase
VLLLLVAGADVGRIAEVESVNGAQLVFCNVPARSADSLLPFYGELLGIDPGDFVKNQQSPIPQYYEPITGDGVDITITQRNDTREVTVTYWAVEDIESAIERLSGVGGEVVSGPTKIPDGGVTALMLDPEGNFVGLVQLSEQGERYFRAGRFREEFADNLERRREEARSGANAA